MKPYFFAINICVFLCFYFLFMVFLHLFYCCSSTVVNIFPQPLPLPSSPPTPTSHLQSYPLWLCPWVLYACSLTMLPLLSPVYPPAPSLWLLLVCSLFQYLWLYFACLFVLLIRFHLQVRSYGICVFTTWLISLSIMLSSSIHAVMKGRSSFFLLHSIPLCKCTTVF